MFSTIHITDLFSASRQKDFKKQEHLFYSMILLRTCLRHLCTKLFMSVAYLCVRHVRCSGERSHDERTKAVRRMFFNFQRQVWGPWSNVYTSALKPSSSGTCAAVQHRISDNMDDNVKMIRAQACLGTIVAVMCRS